MDTPKFRHPEAASEIVSPTSRIEGAIIRGPEIEILVDDHLVRAFEGESVVAALLASGQRAFHTTVRTGDPRGVYCGIGTCFECTMTVDGQPNVRSCQTAVRRGMRIETQAGYGSWRVAQ